MHKRLCNRSQEAIRELAKLIKTTDEFKTMNKYKREIEKTFGQGSCHVLKVRAKGGCKVL